jgi:hypothetical protein
MEKAIKDAGEKATLRYDEEEFRLVAEGEAQHLFNLGNAYAEFCAAAEEERPKVVRRFVRSWFSRMKELPADFEDLSPDLLPGVRSRAYFELTRLDFQLKEMPPPDWPLQVLGEHFAVCLVYDFPEAIRQLQQSDLDGWKVDFATSLERACVNLAERSQEPFVEVGPGVWRSPWRDNHDAARIVLPDLLRQQPIEGDPVVMIPNRDTLLLTGSEDAKGLTLLAALAAKALDDPRSISGIALRWDGAQWAPFLPDSAHPASRQYQGMWVQTLGPDYTQQKELLNALHERTGDDVFVASYNAVQNNDTGRIRTYSVWSQGVDTLLPRTDTVCFVVVKGGEGEMAAEAPWDRVVEECGDLMTAQGWYPERYRVKKFPTKKQLALLAAE